MLSFNIHNNDSDMDGVPDKDDSMPLKKGELKPFGTVEYEDEVNSKAETLYNDSLDSGTTPDSQTLKYDLPTEYLNVNDMVSLKQTILKFGKEKALSRAAIGIMMKDVNDNQDYLQYISDEDWLKFCEFFNKHVIGYGSVNEDIHYFRLKLNRTPDSFIDLVADADNWHIYPKINTRYHMNNNADNNNQYYSQYISSNLNYPSYSTYGNEYNMKFVDKYGMNEVVVTPNKELSGMSNEEIYNYLTDASHWQILTDNYVKAQTNTYFKYDPVNVGTYNYVAYDKSINFVELDGVTKRKTKSTDHKKYDVNPYLGGNGDYSNWGNVPGLIYDNTSTAKKRNYSYYEDKCMIDKQDKIFDKWVSKIAKN